MSDNVIRKPDREPLTLRTRIILFSGLALVALTLVALFLFRDRLDLDETRRWFRYLGNSSVNGSEFSFDAHGSNQYAALDGGLVVLSTSGVSVYAADGSQKTALQVSMDTPALRAGDDRVLSFDVGGHNLLTAGASEKYLMQVTSERPLLDADISPDGWVCDCTSKTGYKSVLNVYNPDGARVYRWLSSSQYLTLCTVSEDGEYLAAVALGQSGGIFESRLLLFRTDSEQIVNSFSLGNQLFYDLEFDGSGAICAVGENSTLWVRTDGTLLGKYSYDGAYLKDYDFGGDGFLTLSLNMYKAGNRCTIVTVQPDGTVLGSGEIEHEILDTHAAGEYIAILTSTGLLIYRQDMELYAQGEDTTGATDLLLYADGSALLLSGGSGTLFVP